MLFRQNDQNVGKSYSQPIAWPKISAFSGFFGRTDHENSTR